MIVNVNFSKEVFNYFKGYDLSEVANTLLEIYDFTNLPTTSGERFAERKVNITNQLYIDIYQLFGPRSNKVSLSRLFEFACAMDVLNEPNFELIKTGEEDSPVPSLLTKAYITLLVAQKYSKDPTLKDITDVLYSYKETL